LGNYMSLLCGSSIPLGGFTVILGKSRKLKLSSSSRSFSEQYSRVDSN